MKLFVTLVFGLAVESGAVSFHSPTTQKELSDLQLAQTLVAEIGTDLDPKSAYTKQLMERQATVDKTDRDVNASEKDKADARKDLERLKLAEAVKCNKAIKAVSRAYGIKPDVNSAPLTVGGQKGEFVGKRATWIPVFDSHEKPRTEIDAKGGTQEVPAPPKTWYSATWSDGQITIGPKAFTSPAFLAAAIVHETAHFDQHTSERGRRIGEYSAETEAFGKVLAGTAELGLNSTEVKQIVADRDFELNAISNGWGWAGSGFAQATGSAPPPENLESIKEGSNGDFYGGLAGLKGVSDEAQRLASAKAHKDDYTWEQLQKESAEWMRNYDDDIRKRYAVVDYLGAVAALACSDPNEFQKQIDQKQFVDAVLGLSQIVPYKNNQPGNCKESVLDSIRNASGPVSPATVLSWAQRYHVDHPGFFQRLANALERFAQARDNVAAQSSSSGGGESHSGGGESREPPEPRSSGGGGQARGLSTCESFGHTSAGGNHCTHPVD